MVRLLRKLTGLSAKDAPQAGYAFVFLFCVLACYYILQPLRDEIGLLMGEEYTPRLFVASMVVMVLANPVFAYLLNRYGRVSLIKSVYRFFALNVVLFIACFKYFESTGQMASHGEAVRVTGIAFAVATVFFLWVGIFSLFASSMFWALMADIYTGDQGKRVFGFLGAGGTLGQLFGSLLTKYIVKAIPDFQPTNLLFVGVVLLEVAVQMMLIITRNYEEPARKEGEEKPSALSGATDILKSPYLLGICLYLFLYTFTSSFIYFQKQQIVAASVADRGGRVGFFSDVNIAVGLMTFLIQLFLTGGFISVIGLSAGLSMVPIIGLLGFLALAKKPDLSTIFWLDIVRRTANFAISRPSREILFTAVPRREKYLAKNFIDTVVYRLGDSAAAFVFGIFFTVGTNPVFISLSAVGASVVYLASAVGLGRAHGRRTAQQRLETPVLDPDPPPVVPTP